MRCRVLQGQLSRLTHEEDTEATPVTEHEEVTEDTPTIEEEEGLIQDKGLLLKEKTEEPVAIVVIITDSIPLDILGMEETIIIPLSEFKITDSQKGQTFSPFDP